MPVQLNKDSEKFAMKLIRAGDISNASWSFSAADGNKILGPDEDWKTYALYHLGKDSEFTKETKAYYKYPFGKAGKVYMAALRNIRVRASQFGATSVFDAAGRLLDAAKEKLERSGQKEFEMRSEGEIRKTPTSEMVEEGIVEAYLTKWDSVDSYKSTFKRGSFKKTFQERGGKIRLIWNHEELAGKVLEAREDDYGPFVRVKFNLDTRSGKEAFSHVKHGDVDSFSFGFNVIKDGWKDGIREITEVRCMECGPVIFEANSQAKIVDVRADDFSQTFANTELRERGRKLRHALDETLDDVIWNTKDKNSIVPLIDKAISDFHGQYLAWLQEIFEMSDNQDKIRKISSKNDLSYAVRSELDIEETVKATSLTESELDKLSKGKILNIESRSKLVELPENIQNAHRLERRKAVESLCNELRQGGFTDGEKARFDALLKMPTCKDTVDETINLVKNIRKNINLK